MQEDLFDLRGMVRKRDHSTSADAAQVVSGKLSDLQEQVFMFVSRYGPVSDDQIWQRFGYMAESTARKRRTELTQKGLIEECGITVNRRGRSVKMWRAKV